MKTMHFCIYLYVFIATCLSKHYGKYLEVDLIGSKATNEKQKTRFFYFFLALIGVWTKALSVSSLLPCHLSHLQSLVGHFLLLDFKI